VSPNGREKTGYPTQKPLGVLQRIVKVHSEEGDELLDFFAGSGTLGEAGASLGRSVTLIDDNEEALSVMGTRLARFISRDGPASPRERETRDRDYDDGAVGTDAGELAAKSAIAPTLTADMPSPRPDPKNQGDLFA
jgi:hypothetical protein